MGESRSSISQLEDICEQFTKEDLEDDDNKWLDVCLTPPTIQEQLPLFLKAIQPSNFSTLLEIAKNIEAIARTLYPQANVVARPFGSSVTQLNFKSSDVDIFLDFSTLPVPPEKLVKVLSQAIYKCRKVFTRSFPIYSKTPIVRCQHFSGISCDVSFTNSLGIINSELIQFYFSLDERIRYLTIILKFWMNKQNLIGPNFITSYALTIMVLFYLQQHEMPLVPSFYYLQVSAFTSNLVADWETSFIKDKALTPPINNRLSVFQLLQGFFEFYSTFEFGMYVISPHIGKTILKSFLTKPALLPPEFRLYKVNLLKDSVNNEFDIVKYMCVQDPIKHSHNVTRNTQKKWFFRFVECCGTALRLCEEEVKKRNRKNYKSEFLRELFRPVRAPDEGPKKKARANDEIKIHLGKNLIFNESVEWTETGLRNTWSNTVMKMVQDVLTRVLKCTVRVEQGEAYQVGRGGEGGTEAGISTVLYCVMDHNMLLNKKMRERARTEFEFPTSMIVIEQEEMLSNFLLDEVIKDKKLGLEFNLTYYLKKQPTMILIEMDTSENDGLKLAYIRDVFQGLARYLPDVVDSAFDYLFKL